MRSILLAVLAVVSGLAASPTWSQSWSGSLPAVQTDARTLTFEVSSLENLLAWNFYLAFSPSAFATPAITLSSQIQGGASDFVDIGLPVAPVAGDFADPIPSGYQEIVGSASYLFPISAAGSIFSVQFEALPTALGPTQVFSRFYYALDNGVDIVEQTIDLQPLSTNIAAVPEPGTWAMMLAGVGLVGFRAARRRQTRA